MATAAQSAPPARLGWRIPAAACALRWAVFAAALWSAGGKPVIYEPDSHGYVALAGSLVGEGRFVQHRQPELYRTPGYPLFLIPGVLLKHPAAYAILIQGLLGALTVALTWRLALAVGASPSAAHWAAVLLTVEPLTVLYAGKLLTETLFTCLLTAAVWLLAEYGRWPSLGRVSAAAALLAASVYVRPVAYYLPLLLGPALLLAAWLARGATGPRVTWRHAVALVAVMALAVAPWLVRNRIVCDYDQFCSTPDVKLYFVQARAVQGMLRDGRYPPDLNVMDLGQPIAEHPEQANWTPGQRLRWLRREGARTLRAAPLTYARIHVWEILDTLLDNGTMAYLDMFRRVPVASSPETRAAGAGARLMAALRDKPAFVATYGALSTVALLYLAAALAGLVLTLRRRGPWLPRALMFTVLAYLLLVSVGPVGGHRYRLPMLPLLCVLAGTAAARFQQAAAGGGQKTLVLKMPR